MSTASHTLPGQPSFGGLLARILFIVIIWALLVLGTLHYVGYVWPKAYQISLAEKAQAEEREKTALSPPAATPPAATAAAPAGSSAPTPAASAVAASASAPAASSAPSASASTTPVVPAAVAASTPAAGSTAAASAAPASTAAPAAASAPKAATGEQKLPFDIRLAGFNRTALENVSIFFSIVISVFCVGAIILQIFKYKRTEA